MTITKNKLVTLIAHDQTVDVLVTIRDNKDNHQWIDLICGDSTICLPRKMLYQLSQTLADFEST